MGCRLIALVMQNATAWNVDFSQRVTWSARKSPGTCSPETLGSRRIMAGVSLPCRRRALADQAKTRQGGKNRPRRWSAHLRSQPGSLCIAVCLWGGRTSNLHLQSGERGEQIARLWLGIKWERARTSNKQTGSFLCLCSPFLSRSCSPSGSSISISRALSSRLQRELGLNQSNCQRWNCKLSCYHETYNLRKVLLVNFRQIRVNFFRPKCWPFSSILVLLRVYII